MKNYQQTPKQRRMQIKADRVAAVKCFTQSRIKDFQPKEAWSTDRKVCGVPQSVLDSKQQKPGWQHTPFGYIPRGYRRQRERTFVEHFLQCLYR
ncbi:hypothetical protein [Flavobacterium sp.]|jgi:hypothetical protein|uniref:hypothetical protein n=1 Tax=Flavobacterium sp. TaxID=239 RepID=UPI0037BEA3DF